MTGTDHVARLRALIAAATDVPSQFAPRLTLVERDIEYLCAALDELERLRTDLAAARDDSSEVALAERNEELRDELVLLRVQRTTLDGQVFVAGWYAHAEACALLGWDAREAAWRKYRDEMTETLAKGAPQQPERGGGPLDLHDDDGALRCCCRTHNHLDCPEGRVKR